MTTKIMATNSSFLKFSIFIMLFGLTLTACDTVSDTGNRSKVQVQFKLANNPNTQALTVAKVSKSDSSNSSDSTLVYEGANGTLRIAAIKFIVDDLDFTKAEGPCKEVDEKKEDTCEEFETKPFLVDLPLNGKPFTLPASFIKEGTYSQIDFEIGNLAIDTDEDSTEKEENQTLLAKIRSNDTLSDWPEEASIVVSGTFTDNFGKTKPFVTYINAEVSIERTFSTPLKIGSNTGNQQISISINPAEWFTRADGSIVNLRNYDYPQTERILEIEVENGFMTAEVERDE